MNNDKEFLTWIYSRLVFKGDDPNTDFMYRLKTIINEMPEDKTKPRKRCIVYGCSNHTDEGTFIGELCAPCRCYLAEGKIGPTDSFLGIMRTAIQLINRHTK